MRRRKVAAIKGFKVGIMPVEVTLIAAKLVTNAPRSHVSAGVSGLSGALVVNMVS